jgi:hypothetical protein
MMRTATSGFVMMASIRPENRVPPRITNADIRGNPYRVREPHNAALTEIWMVSAIVTVLVIRLYLFLTGYPQVGGDTLHIAHMLWGGLFMVVAFAMVMLFAHQVWKPIAALVGGIGFGTFIDELGKFITQDNDYFFEPTISIMYGIFIALYLLSRYLDRKREPTEADHLFLAVQGVQWQAIGKLDKRRQEIALEHLDRSGVDSPLVDEIRGLLENADLIDSASQSRLYALREKAVNLYWQIVGNSWFRRLIVGFFVIRLLQIFGAGLLSWLNGTLDLSDGLAWSEWLALGTGFVSGLLGVYAVIQMLRRKRVLALQALALSALVSLFFGQFFAFAADQFAALTGLVLDLAVLGSLRLALSAEHDRMHEEDTDEDSREGLGRFL